MSAARSNRREVRNPILALPELQAILALPIDQREALAGLLGALAVTARAKAQASWLKNKGPMAAYWKAAGAYATHIKHAVRRGSI
jgi:hypothetical protein